ncbi:methionine aminopeptidase, type I [Thermoanaerobacter mathranii subsp. mathranii str. A3]|jgi:methionyl aminopeptidase|uniref:Methionine aminopeptidase n=2 Tax=Thermoanaerobacter TaxID=1754 RepID=A0ABT9M3T7_9THEO|nr:MULTISPECIES: type I methionyl aminopeptidase [Thermoanaerobacter]ADH61599.1 methionine aminopeptidase, type I [Thermoanaerobacter mathranii subsp. mathranii str. A3]MDP9750789.1 methionyl aminopeptidase [Thermoanaerobacter pentosaceus]
MIYIKSENEIDLMRTAGKVIANLFEVLEKAIKPGVTTLELDRIAEEFIIKNGCKPAFKGLYGFPASICTSINEEVVHGIPSLRKLKEGDIISIDLGASYKGYNADAARTFSVGEISEEAQKLIEVTKNSFFEGIKYAKEGNRLSDISHAIQTYVESYGFSVVREYVGHGIGIKMHEDPQVPNFGPPGRGPRLKKGMCLAIEPMVNTGHYIVKTLENNWTVVTADGGLSAHYENTIVITEGEPEILTIL